MRATAMFAKIKAESPLPMPAWQTLRMATIDGATALGIDDTVGTLEAGKDADLIMLDLTRPPLAPVLLRPARNLVANLVYAETGRNGTYTNVDVNEVHARLLEASERLQTAVAADPMTADLPIVELTSEGKM